MKTKAKKFSNKLLALFMAVVMGITCFSGVFSAFASNKSTYADGNVEYNTLGWSVLSDEQVATAVLDYADEMLPALRNVEYSLARTINRTSVSVLHFNWDTDARTLQVYAQVLVKITLATFTVKLDSVDGLLETLQSVNKFLTDSGLVQTVLGYVDLGIITDLNLTSIAGLSRSGSTSCDIVRGVLGILYNNSDLLLGNLFRGELSLGVLNETIGGIGGASDLYGLIGNLLGVETDVKANPAYNIVQALLFNYTEWFTDEEEANYIANPDTFRFDEVLIDKMSTELLSKISIPVTYSDGTSSESRYKEIKAVMDTGKTYAQAAASLGYNPDLVYTDEFADADGNYKNILLFAYGSPDETGLATDATNKVSLTLDDSLFAFGKKALDAAWNTVLKDSVKLIHVNYDVDRGHGSNFDNEFYYWMKDMNKWTGVPATDYTAANVEAWADAVYESYAAESRDEFLGWVQHNFEHVRTAAEDSEGKWDDINSTSLFNKLRYSPLADLYFNMETGPINLYFSQLGTPNLDKFFETEYAKYDSMVAAFNDLLVAAVKDIFVDSDNIRGTVPTMATVNPGAINDAAVRTITETLIDNALKVVQYTADATDENILKAFYDSGKTVLTEENLEGAMIPMLIACIGNVKLNGAGNLAQIIHPADWDKCADAEAVAFVCLREYLSYVLPDKDYNVLVNILQTEDGEKYDVDFNGAILPMARDAIIYVVESAVPVTDKDGKTWKVEDKAVDDENDVFELFNSVLCYYADDYTVKTGRSMGIASLLGICDTNGESLINIKNTLWENLDLVVEHLLPVIGVLQGLDGKVNSEKLIMGDIVNGVLEISNPNADTGYCGVSNFIYRFLTIVTADPIQNDRIVDTVYDFLKDLLNGLFGSRDGSNVNPVPARVAGDAYPFDTFLQKETIAGTNASNPGAIQKLVNNFVAFTGFNGNKDSALRGLFFAITGVNSFITLLPSLTEHHLEAATIGLDTAFANNMGSGDTHTTNLNITNNSTGINKAYLDGKDDSVHQLSRYYIQPTGITVNGQTPSAAGVTVSLSSNLIAPTETYTTSIATKMSSSSDSKYEIVVTYNITDANGNAIAPEYTGLKLTAYEYLTTAKDWKESVYPSGRIDANTDKQQLASGLETNSNGSSKTDSSTGYTAYTTAAFGGSKRLNVLYPEYIVVSSDDYAAADRYTARIRNTSGTFGGAASMDGWFCYDEATVYNDATNANVTVNQNNAIPVYDKATGDILKVGLYDVTTDGGLTWDRTGYSSDEADSQIAQSDADAANCAKRTHVVYTVDEAIQNGIMAAYHINSDTGICEYVYLKSGNTGYAYDTLLDSISLAGPVDGFIMNSQKITQAKNSSAYFELMYYDGETTIDPGVYTRKIHFYSSSNTNGVADKIKFVVASTDSKTTLLENYQATLDVLSNYQAEDFTDSSVLDTVKNSLNTALQAAATPVTEKNWDDVSDNVALTASTKTEASEYGDLAYVPFTSANAADLPATWKASATIKNGVYYIDKACTMAYYSPVELTADDVTNGKDAAGLDVILNPEDGKYYVKNAAAYETEWSTVYGTDAPYKVNTDVQATNGSGKLLYTQVQYVYYDAYGEKTTSKDAWVVKFADASNKCLPNAGTVGSEDNRGVYSRSSDLLAWTLEYVADNAVNLASRLNEQISESRVGINQNNFDITTYNQTIKAAKAAEANYSIDITYLPEKSDELKTVKGLSFTDYHKDYEKYNDPSYVNYDSTVVTMNSSLTSLQVAEYIRLYNFYAGYMEERGYVGDQLEAEILCASGNTYDKMTATAAVYDDEGNCTTEAVVTKAAGAADPKFGTWDANGNLANDGTYSDASWAVYVEKLAAAVALANYGNTTYAHADRAYYVASDKENYDAQITKCYSTDSELQAAEIALTPLESVLITVADVAGATVTVNGAVVTGSTSVQVGDVVTIEASANDGYEYQYMLINGDKVYTNPYVVEIKSGTDAIVVEAVVEAATSDITVSGTVMIATDVTGTSYTKGVVGINVLANGEVVGTSESDGTFTVTVPAGTTELVFAGSTTVDRTVTLGGDANVTDAIVPIVICDYNHDTNINAADKSTFLSAFTGSYNVYCDLNADGVVNAADKSFFLGFFGKTVAYNDLTIG